MKDLALSFKNGRYSLLEGIVSNFDATAQAACVCLLTTAGSSKLTPEKGTSLAARLLSAGASGEIARRHQLNFASIDTHFFVNSLKGTRDNEKISTFELQETEFKKSNLELNLFLTGERGSVAGINMQPTMEQ